MDTSEIDEQEINVEEIMRRIRENIRMRKEESICQGKKVNGLGQPEHKSTSLKDLQYDLERVNSSSNIQNNNYLISSHKRVTGKVLVKCRELVHGEVRRYVDPMVFKQIEFNKNVAKTLNHAIRRIIELENSIDLLRTEIDEKIEGKMWLADAMEQKTDDMNVGSLTISSIQNTGVNYFAFEGRFRGSREDIKQRQSVFLQYFNPGDDILDIGCGRGEFLELLKENCVHAHGIDIDEGMVSYCLSRGLDVEKIDAITYLEKVEDNTLSGIFIDQVIEHLEPPYLVKLLRLCYKKLMYGGNIVAETVNPLSLYSFANFYIDMGHKKPVHPATLEFLFEYIGFRDVEIKFFSFIPDEKRLRKIDLEETTNDREKQDKEIYNHNIDMLNNILYGPQDYAAIGKK